MSELVPGLSQWVMSRLARELKLRNLRVVVVRDQARAAGSLRDVCANARQGVIRVWGGASDKTIFELPAHNHAMRALHDLWHMDIGAQFDLLGELRVHDLTMDIAPAEFRDALTADGAGQSLYCAFTQGKFPEDQRAFALNVIGWQAQGLTLEAAVWRAIGAGL